MESCLFYVSVFPVDLLVRCYLGSPPAGVRTHIEIQRRSAGWEGGLKGRELIGEF